MSDPGADLLVYVIYNATVSFAVRAPFKIWLPDTKALC